MGLSIPSSKGKSSYRDLIASFYKDGCLYFFKKLLRNNNEIASVKTKKERSF